MGYRCFTSLPLSLTLFSVSFVVCVSQSLNKPELLKLHEKCRKEEFNCGSLSFKYPFSGGKRDKRCGHPQLHLNCESGNATLDILNVRYQVLDFHPDRRALTIVREELILNGFCSPKLKNPNLDFKFVNAPGHGYPNLTLFYDCPSTIASPIAGSIRCKRTAPHKNVTTVMKENITTEKCSANVTIPILQSSLDQFYSEMLSWKQALINGFEVQWKEEYDQACQKCRDTNGACGFNESNFETTCHCLSSENVKECSISSFPARPTENPTTGHEKSKLVWELIAAGAAGATRVGTIVGMLILLCKLQRKKTTAHDKSIDHPTPFSNQRPPTSTRNLSQIIPLYPTLHYHLDLERGRSYFGARLFTYEELQQATNNFSPSKKLGEGGFGIVYYGVLNDESVVAVKRLYESNCKSFKHFMNEIEILSHIRHPNLVTLYGCTSKLSRELLLVYEYIPNGTVADHLHGQLSNFHLLTWPIRFRIATETANALAYLHATNIVHRDVKTNNILLDTNFHVKVADFGLSRLFPNNVSHVSTTPQGTPGYVDPEYHRCYQLTEKSDVYSFGVVLIELISAKQAVDTNRHRHDINLANMALSKIQNNALYEMVDPLLCFENDYAVKEMITAISELAFQCLQQEGDMRPSMEEVLEILRGIKCEELGTRKAEVLDMNLEAKIVDATADDVGLQKQNPTPLSPCHSVTDK